MKHIINHVDLSRFKHALKVAYYYPNKVPSAPDIQIETEKVEMADVDRKAKFRRYLTEWVGLGWHIEIENDFDAVISRKRKSGWFGTFVVFIIFLLIFAPLAIFYLIYVIVTRTSGKKQLVKVWIDIYGDLKNSNSTHA